MEKKRKTGRKDFTIREVRYLEENYGKLKPSTIARKLGRSLSAIYNKASDMGLTGPRLAHVADIDFESIRYRGGAPKKKPHHRPAKRRKLPQNQNSKHLNR